MSRETGAKRGKGKRVLRVTLIVVGVIVVLLAAALIITEPERREGRDLPIAAVDFSAVPDGTYVGRYAGGRYGWRANEVRVTVASGKVTKIEVLSNAGRPLLDVTNPLFERVIKSQSLQVDTVSGATITSKAYLKSVEEALTGASQK